MIDGKQIKGKSVKPGDIIMNEWTNKHLKVDSTESRFDYSTGRKRRSILLHCTRLDDGRPETLSGPYYSGITRLIRRADIAAAAGEEE